jgi:flagellar hook assembly protein FlgD
MAITQNRSTDLTRRQAFNGKGLTFIEVIFAQSITTTATTPEALNSDFDKVTKVINKNGTLLAASYRLAAKATDNDAAEASEITADNSIDSYQYIVEGGPGQFNAADTAGDVNMEWDGTNDATVVADAEADLEADIRAVLSSDSSNNTQHVKIRTLLPEGVTSSGDDAIYGMFDQRGDA